MAVIVSRNTSSRRVRSGALATSSALLATLVFTLPAGAHAAQDSESVSAASDAGSPEPPPATAPTAPSSPAAVPARRPASSDYPEPARTTAPESTASATSSHPMRLDLYLGPSLAMGTAPALATGARLGLQARFDWLRLFAEGRTDFPAAGQVEDRYFSSSVTGAGFGVCFTWNMLFACGVGTAGVLSWSHGVRTTLGAAERDRGTEAHVALGGRGGVEVDISPKVGLRAQLEGLGVVTNRTFTVSRENDDVRKLSGSAAVFGVYGVLRLF